MRSGRLLESSLRDGLVFQVDAMLNKASQMDFIRILRSLEEFLYEVMTWLVFYPRTLLRSAARPIEILDYSRADLRKPEEEQCQDALSAPLFLIALSW